MEILRVLFIYLFIHRRVRKKVYVQITAPFDAHVAIYEVLY